MYCTQGVVFVNIPASEMNRENSGKTQFKCPRIDDKLDDRMFSYNFTLNINAIIAPTFAEIYCARCVYIR